MRLDLIRLADVHRTGLYEPALTAKAITRLVFAMAATAMDLPDEQLPALSQHLVVMVRMILAGTESLAANPQQVLADLRPRRAAAPNPVVSNA